MLDNPIATIIVVTRNRLQILEKMLSEMRKQEKYAAFEIIVANDAGEVDIKEKFGNFFPEISFINFSEHLGLIELRNRLFKAAKADFVFFLDDDSWFEQENAVICAIEIFKQYPEAGVLSFRVRLPRGSFIPEDAGKKDPYETGRFFGCAHAIRKSFFLGTDIYDGDYFRQGEERDLAIRCLDKGLSILQVNGITVYHAQIELGRSHRFIHAYAFSNEMFFYLKYFPGIFCHIFMVKCLISHSLFCFKKRWFKAYFFGLRRILKNFFKFKRKRQPVKITTLKKYLHLAG